MINGFEINGAEINGSGFTQILVTLTDALELSPTLRDTPAYIFRETLGVGVSMTPWTYYQTSQSEGLTTGDGLGVAWPLSVSEQLTLTPVVTPVLGILVAEQLSLAPVFTDTRILLTALAETASYSEAIEGAYHLTWADTLNLSRTARGDWAKVVTEQLSLLAASTQSTLYGHTVAEGLNLSDAALRYLGGELLESIALSELVTHPVYATRTVSELLEMSPTATPTMMFRAVAAEALELDDTDMLQMLYNGTLTDTLELSLTSMLPNGGIMAWAINTRTSAVTQYENFEFNSFAEMYPHYLGASSTGLYELTGDTDAGDDIVATIRSGYAQFTGTRLGALDAAYLAVRGAGDFVLRVITADGQAYTYSVTAQSMKTARVSLGRGLRARYIAFELTSAGQDFDLDSLEFLPLALSRRV